MCTTTGTEISAMFRLSSHLSMSAPQAEHYASLASVLAGLRYLLRLTGLWLPGLISVLPCSIDSTQRTINKRSPRLPAIWSMTCRAAFDVVLIGFNTLFNLETQERQQACLNACSQALTPDGIVVIEGLTPPQQPDGGMVDDVSIRSMTATHVVLSISRHHQGRTNCSKGSSLNFQKSKVCGCGHGVSVKPIDQLDAMATAAGLQVTARFNDASRSAFDPANGRHLTVYSRSR